tara:strand:- start:149 stop:1081 length:933 start_codon:yes stop_codon:yes gene_type:complete
MEEKNSINIAIKKLFAGELIIFPTETVYGIGADATNHLAVKKIYKIKKRPLNNPIISHFKNLKKVSDHVELNEYAIKLAESFWPGPLTLILKKKKLSTISPHVSNYNKLIGCRVPNHPVINKIFESFNRPIAAPSANISTKLSVTNYKHLDKKFKKNVFTISGGNCNLGLESTVINLVTNIPTILRYGSISTEEIKKIIPDIQSNVLAEDKPISPGKSIKHYSPNIPIRINVNKVLKGEVLLNFGLNNLTSNVLELNLSIAGDLKEASKNFFSYLHKLDSNKHKGIAVAPIPNTGLGKTINDRLIRASSK